MSKGILKVKSFEFAVRVINLYKFLCKKENEVVLSKQLLRSGTSVGANVREAEFAASKSDFIYKLSISQKETNETLYWLELLYATDYLTKKQFESLNNDAVELIKLITASIKTAKSALKTTKN